MDPGSLVFHKPKKFIVARNLLFAGILLSSIAFVLRNFRLSMPGNMKIVGLLSTGVGYVVLIVLIKQMDLCKKWARTVLTVLYIIGFILVIISFATKYIMNLAELLLWGLRIVAEAIALFFLYGKDCENWFNSSKYQMFEK
jgi:hypothetical protein